MPKLTNRFDLPVAFERYDAKDPYTKGDADFSVTELIDAPQIRHLKKKYDDELTEDIADRIMSILGTAIHSILEHNAEPGDIPERRFYAEVLGKKISGQCDLLSPSDTESLGLSPPDTDDPQSWVLKDYKTTRGASIVMNPRGSESWQNQINCYAYLAEVNGFKVVEGEVIAVIRDWTASLVRRSRDFPKHPVVRIPIDIWSFEKRKAYVEERVRLHCLDDPPPCTDEERWRGRTVFAVTEYRQDGGLKARATKLFDNETDAVDFIISKGLNAEIVRRDPQPTRCDGNYCQVAQFCTQWNSEERMGL